MNFEGFTKFVYNSIWPGIRTRDLWNRVPKRYHYAKNRPYRTILTCKNRTLKVSKNLIVIQSDTGFEHGTVSRSATTMLKINLKIVMTWKKWILKVWQNLFTIQSDPGFEHGTFETVSQSATTMLKIELIEQFWLAKTEPWRFHKIWL